MTKARSPKSQARKTRMPSCPHCCAFPAVSEAEGRVQRFGTFRRKNRLTKIPRYRCKGCRRTFSAATFLPEYRQKKRHRNKEIFTALVSGTGLRQTGRVLGLAYKTVASRLRYFDGVCTTHTKNALRKVTPINGFTRIQFDDMETSHHTKLKPLSIPLTVVDNSRLILAFDVVSMPAKGHLAAISRRKYGFRPDHLPIGWKNVLSQTSTYTSKDVIVTSDSHPSYPRMLRRHLPHGEHIRTEGREAVVAGLGEMKKGGQDPLFPFNHTAAMNRAHINRLFRRTWCTTKRVDRLVTHLRMYQLWHNERIIAKSERRKLHLPF